jgi:hypothetical protein
MKRGYFYNVGTKARHLCWFYITGLNPDEKLNQDVLSSILNEKFGADPIHQEASVGTVQTSMGYELTSKSPIFSADDVSIWDARPRSQEMH